MRSQSALALAAAAALSACSSGAPAPTSQPDASSGSAGNSGAGGSSGSSGGSGSSGSGGASGSQGTGGGSGSGGGTGGSGPGGSGGSTDGADGGIALRGPCDIYQSANTPCVAAHSTARALYGAYSGKLYQVRRASDKATLDIPVSSPGGFADSAQQDTFCAGTTCVISTIYDQSPMANDMSRSPPVHWLPNGGKETNATAAKIKVGGHTVYGIYVVADAGNTYRNNGAKGLAKGDEPEAIYMVVDGKRYNDRCCFDYGNVETSGNDDGNATMEALEFGNITLWSPGADNGPWVSVDLENGVFTGAARAPDKNTTNTSLVGNYVTLMLKDPSSNRLILKGADAQSGTLAVKYDGVRSTGFSPQHKEGAVELGVGGDGSSGGIGTFFEGAVTSGSPPDAIDEDVQANVVAAGYGR